MNSRKELFVTSFALFSLFFGAGNLLLPPLLGYNSGEDWVWVTIGFMITAVAIPIIGIFAHAKLQGTMYDFGKKVSPIFSLVYCVIVYIISVAIPSPRTASATHEIAIHPAFGTSPLTTSLIYFILVLVFVLNRSKILNIIGKFLTPMIVIMLLLVIGIGLYSSSFTNIGTFETPIVSGILEGYQTFDAIGAVVVGGVIIISINFKNTASFEIKKQLIRRSGLIAGLGLFIIYAGLISVGAYYGTEINIDNSLSNDMQRANLLSGISLSALGAFGNTVLCILISLACFTTAVGIIAGTADYFKGLFHNSQNAYIITAVIACAFGVGVGQLDFSTIIHIALPVLMFIYPITIILILLNVMPDRLASKTVFRGVVLITFIFSIPDFLGFIIPRENIQGIVDTIPLAQYTLGWVIPAFVTFIGLNFSKLFLKANH
ncbi:branched-chain amino acid transport system II carrier protein [Winogradskyella immobilis]|uniref:Branched-chain amino acid transport system II carrier protein n=1 Tax=Winogradskyella immobilis TaxID=2816852 RepID=A0ABS8EJH1_9FLAO|nr:branched-chain amino acid transport system II carrier protein [Winogradskyella immobilis]MCC1483313.1 branched-chain amino acid transport system II carrier protein [Winogradskyella immobilis]MCG0015407.1 branched-chain amino acid transport system II carrier protein [Winogradskyella immobilis]